MIYYLILLIMTVLGSVASLFLKKASGMNGIFKMLLNFNLYVGAFLYLLSAILNIYVLKFLDYSVVLPLTAITYIWTLIISHHFLKEKISPQKIIGVLLIIIGSFCVALY